MRKIRKNLTSFLTVSDFVAVFALIIMVALIVGLLGCSSSAAPLNLDWEIWDRPDHPAKACLSEKDVDQLRETLIRCKGSVTQ